jgi:hypothetical protein
VSARSELALAIDLGGTKASADVVDVDGNGRSRLPRCEARVSARNEAVVETHLGRIRALAAAVDLDSNGRSRVSDVGPA